MGALRNFAARFRSVLQRSRADRDFEQELQSHVEMLTDDNVSRGMGPDQARRAATLMHRLGIRMHAYLMLGYPDVPSHQADMPSFADTQARLLAFTQVLASDEGADMDLDAELDRLEADLQAIIGAE